MTGPPTEHGLNCDCCGPKPQDGAAGGITDTNNLTNADFKVTAAEGPDQSATSNVTDLRRARQRARASIRGLMDEILAWLGAQNIQTLFDGPRPERAVNQAITELAKERLRQELVNWLDERHTITMGRAGRDAFDKMRQAAPDAVDQDDFRGTPNVDGQDQDMIRLLRQVDAGLIYEDDDSLAEEIGNDITRQLRLGVSEGETNEQLAQRVRQVMDEGDSPERQKNGVTGQTKRTKAELIAHDSVQDAYNTAARKRYLRNGFRYAVFDATVDTKTTPLCMRMNEHVIDLRETPMFIPPLHPFCRSGIRPILDAGDRSVLARDDVADDLLQTIMATKSYRPPVVSEDEFQPTPLSEQYGHTGA